MVIPPQTAFKHIATAARTANRVVAVVQGESENSEDPQFKTELGLGSQSITAGTMMLYLVGIYVHPTVARVWLACGGREGEGREGVEVGGSWQKEGEELGDEEKG